MSEKKFWEYELEARAELGYSQQKMADALGVHIETLRGWEQRQAQPYKATEIRLRNKIDELLKNKKGEV